jgi:hypothetical protein
MHFGLHLTAKNFLRKEVRMKAQLVVWVAIAGLLCVPFPSRAAEVKLTSSTQYLWFNDIILDDDVETVAQYLRLNVSKMDAAGNVTIAGYGRATKQFTSGEDVEGRLYYFYLNYRNLIQDVLDVKLGRHFVYFPSGSGLVDGATLDFKRMGPLGLKLLAGRDVKFVAERNEITGAKDRLTGASLYTDAVRRTHIEASYMLREDDGDTAREIVGGSFSTYLPGNVSVYADTKYDLLTESTSELLTGLKFAPAEKLTLKGEYYQSFPQFDATSIFSVFAVNKYTEKLIAAEYQMTGAYRLALSYAREDFNDGENADLYEAGITARPSANLLFDVSYSMRNGFGGELDGLRFHGTYARGKNSFAAGADIADYRRDSVRSDTAKKYWVGAAHKFSPDVSATARVENNVNVNFAHNYQGVVTLNANF